MAERNLVYFTSDVHLGLKVGDPAGRERRFVSFLRSIPAERTSALYLLGDIWDFWYEYRDVVPKGYIRVFAALTELMDAGVEVHFFSGNHDVWAYHYFESLGIKTHQQPYLVQIGGKTFCLGHGDGLGPVPMGYSLLRKLFHNRIAQSLFSCLHPWIAFRIGNHWSRSNRQSHGQYKFGGEEEPLVRWAEKFSPLTEVDYFIFGHYHSPADLALRRGSRFFILNSWLNDSPFLYFDGMTVLGGNSQNSEK